MTIIDCFISLKMIKKMLVVLGVVDIRQLLLNLPAMFHFQYMIKQNMAGLLDRTI